MNDINSMGSENLYHDIEIIDDSKNNINDALILDIKKAVEHTLLYEKFPFIVEVSVSLVSNMSIKELNKKYRKINKETDVLSFPANDFDSFVIGSNINNSMLNSDFYKNYYNYLEKNPETEKIILGDIVISFEKANHQAWQYFHSISRELVFLTVHGTLHLLGYDHQTQSDIQLMEDKQKKILLSAGVSREK